MLPLRSLSQSVCFLLLSSSLLLLLVAGRQQTEPPEERQSDEEEGSPLLVAYTFDRARGDGQELELEATFGSCPIRFDIPPFPTVKNTSEHIFIGEESECVFGGCMYFNYSAKFSDGSIYKDNSLEVGRWSIGGGANGFALSIWVNTERVADDYWGSTVLYKPASWDFGVLPKVENITDQLIMYTMIEGYDYYLFSNTIIELNQWHHLGLTFDGVNVVRFYLDGEEDAAWELPEPLTGYEKNGEMVQIGAFASENVYPFVGYLDDFRAYRRVLSGEEMKMVYETPIVTLSPMEIVNITNATTVLSGASMTATKPANDSLRCSWYQSGGPCGVVSSITYEDNDDGSISADITFSQSSLATIEFAACCDNGEIATFAASSVTVEGDVPKLTADVPSSFSAEGGRLNTFQVSAVGYPEPTYQWQKRVSGSLEEAEGRESFMGTTMTKTGVVKMPESTSFASCDRVYKGGEKPVCRFGSTREYIARWRRQETNETWVNIANATESTLTVDLSDVDVSVNEANGQTSATFTDPNKSSSDYVFGDVSLSELTSSPNMVLRCLVRNRNGQLTTDPVQLVLLSSANGQSKESDDTGKTVGIGVGVSLGVVVLLLLAIAVVALVLFIRMRQNARPKTLHPPDFKEIAFGEALKDQASSAFQKKSEEYEELEQLLLDDSGPFMQSLFDAAGDIDADGGVIRSVLQLYHYHHRAGELVCQTISHELQKLKDDSTVFRQTTAATTSFTFYSRMVGLPYLWDTLVVPIHEINDTAIKSEKQTESKYKVRDTVSSERSSVADSTDLESGGSTGGSVQMDTLGGRRTSDMSRRSVAASRRHTSNFLEVTSLEVDPSKMKDEEEAMVNTLQLWLVAQKLFSLILRSRNKIPIQILHVLRHIRYNMEQRTRELRSKANKRNRKEKMENKDEESSSSSSSGDESDEVDDDQTEDEIQNVAYRTMGAFLFLRFYCPSLIAPQMYGILEAPPHPTAQRQLILLSKIIQNVANGTLPGVKEGYLEKMGEFITSNQDGLLNFYDALCNEGGDVEGGTNEILQRRDSATIDPTLSPTEHVRENALMFLHAFLHHHISSLRKGSMDGGDDWWNRLEKAVEALGEPAETAE